jgi:hypothetical protein
VVYWTGSIPGCGPEHWDICSLSGSSDEKNSQEA